jgi:hypothetical protein
MEGEAALAYCNTIHLALAAGIEKVNENVRIFAPW